MLRAIRDGSQSILVRALLILIIAGFALWGVQGGSTAPPPIAQVGDETVPQSQFTRQFQNEVNARQRDNDGDYTFEQAYADNVDREVLDRLMFGKAFDNVSNAIGLRSSDAQVLAMLRDIPAFNDVMGEFDRVAYEQEVDRLGITKTTFEERRRDDLERVDLLTALIGAAPAPDALIDMIYAQNLEERSVEYFTIASASITADAPTDEDVRAEYDLNPGGYTSEELRKLTYLTIQISDVINTIEVEEDKIVELYESRHDTYVVAEKRQLQHLIVTDEATALSLQTRLVDGLDLIEAAVETGQLTAEVDLGDVTEDDVSYLGADAATAAFAAADGSITDPVESELGGWVIFKVAGVTPGTATSLEDVREQLRTDVAIEDAQDRILELADQARDMLSEDNSIEEVAEELGLNPRAVNSLNRSGNDQFGNGVRGLPSSRNFFGSAFAKQPGEFDEVEETEGGGYFIVRVDAITPPALKDFDTVKSDIRKILNARNRSAAALLRATGLKIQADDEGSLAGAASASETDVALGEGLRRNGQGVPLAFSRRTVDGVFQANAGDIFISPNRASDGYVIAKIVSVSDVSAEKSGAEYEQLRLNIQRLFANDVVSQYHAFLMDKYPPEINFGIQTQIQEQLTGQ
jgi:peptidyl-prolyl cis-trans isomerase D